MDAKAEAAAGGGGGGEKKAAVAPRDAGGAPSSPREQRSAVAPLSGAGVAAEANVDRSGGAAAGEEDDGGDEQRAVERFYALVANVRAMRGMYRSSGDGASADSATGGNADGGGGERKRARRADQPWRPVFRMEDFADVAGGADTTRSSARADDGARAPPVEQAAGVEVDGDMELRRGRRAAASTSPPPPPRRRAPLP
uniref:Uncharacterized protein n=1 Tax=Oryza punctata TaxID=4537 RepID=A0A0E0L1P1_ORYPU